MRLWHQELISKLPSKKDYKGCSNQLGGQWTEIRMILGSIKKKGKVNHSTVNYVNDYDLDFLYAYGLLIGREMIKRGFNVSKNIMKEYITDKAIALYKMALSGNVIYREHDIEYMDECISNLKSKGIVIR